MRRILREFGLGDNEADMREGKGLLEIDTRTVVTGQNEFVDYV